MSSGTFALLGRRPNESRWVEPLGRAGLVAKAVLYAVIALLAFRVAGGGREEAPDKEGALQAIAGQPFGRGLLALLALGLAGYALWRLAQAVFDREHAGDGIKGVAKRGGQLARGVVFTLIALFLLRAAWEFDPKEARGLDGALLEVAQAPWGGLLLSGVAAGLLCYALYCLVQARYRRV